jgi:dTDP-4-amino-4,6-dideoxygalactose transaminase
VNQFEERITPNTKAAIIVHSVGIPVEMEKIINIAKKENIKIVEDCSQSHGASINQRKVGTFGDIAAFSSMFKKAHITGGSGGVVFTYDLELHHQGLAHADRGKPRWAADFNDRNPSDYLFPALNLHSSELACGVGIASLKRLPETIRARRAWVEKLSNCIGIDTRSCSILEACSESSPFVLPIKVDADLIATSVREFAEAVKLEGIPLNSHYDYLVRDWNWIKNYLSDDFPTNNARSSIDSSFCLYLNEQYDGQEINDVLGAISKCERVFCT